MAIVDWNKREERRRERINDFCSGVCQRCGYSSSIYALNLYNPSTGKKMTRRFILRATNDSIDKAIQSCLYLCSNCAAEKFSKRY